MSTELEICKSDLCGRLKTDNDNVAIAFLAGLAIGALAVGYYYHLKNSGLKSAITFYSGSGFQYFKEL